MIKSIFKCYNNYYIIWNNILLFKKIDNIWLQLENLYIYNLNYIDITLYDTYIYIFNRIFYYLENPVLFVFHYVYE